MRERERDYNNLTILLGNCTKIACIDIHDVDKTQNLTVLGICSPSKTPQ